LSFPPSKAVPRLPRILKKAAPANFSMPAPSAKTPTSVTWQEDESPFAALGKGLADRGLTSGTVGLDENMKFVFAESIRAANPHLTIVSASPVTAGCRMIKDAHEIECLRLACRATLLVYRAVAQSLTVGMTTADVHSLINAAYHRVGFRGEASLNIDEFTALPHGSRQPQTLREGSILMLDDGCDVRGLHVRHHADLCAGQSH
jgi:Xaa-Pro dipeptidase